MLKNRREAGKKLAEKLMEYQNANAIVLALPCVGVVVGYEIARALSLPFGIIAIRKIGHPSNPEYVIGAVDKNGIAVFNESETASLSKQ